MSDHSECDPGLLLDHPPQTSDGRTPDRSVADSLEIRVSHGHKSKVFAFERVGAYNSIVSSAGAKEDLAESLRTIPANV